MGRKAVALGVTAIGAVAAGIWAVRGLRGPSRGPAVPKEITTRAEVPGTPGARYWVGVDIEAFVRDVLEAREREAKHRTSAELPGELPVASLLGVSGGGDNGAFGAGLLCGWSESGSRPQFKAVTGVSTGALIAPFAFAGPEYDRVLRSVFTSVGPSDVARKRSLLAAVNDDAMADNRPLWEQISRHADERLLEKIADEHAKGRILLVGTTNLDACQPVVWNMGKIAASGAPGALDLFRSILLASAAIPGAFPPTMIRVEADGETYEEMHVDGGASAQVFLYPPSMRGVAASLGEEMTRKVHVYIIRNSQRRAAGAPARRRTISIIGPAIKSLIHSQGFGDLARIYGTTQRDGLDFNLAFIDDDFDAEHPEEFDTQYMRALFDYGFRQGRDGYPWKKTPPRFDAGWTAP
jgi:predicted patatin/cPLA2 family phospholipase